MKLDAGKAEAAMRSASREAAEASRCTKPQPGIREVANNQMADLLRRVTTRSGYDPREFVLFAYGGAGPTHACQYAAFAGIATVIAPTTASGHSAFGAVTADRHRSFSLAFGQHAPARFTAGVGPRRVRRSSMTGSQAPRAAMPGRARPRTRIKRACGMRFRQQVHEIEVEVAARNDRQRRRRCAGRSVRGDNTKRSTARDRAARLGGRVHRAACRRHRSRAESAYRRSCRPAANALEAGSPRAAVYFYGKGFAETQVYRSRRSGPGRRLAGPAIVERPDTTIVVGSGQRARGRSLRQHHPSPERLGLADVGHARAPRSIATTGKRSIPSAFRSSITA